MKPWQNLERRPQSSEKHGRPNEKDSPDSCADRASHRFVVGSMMEGKPTSTPCIRSMDENGTPDREAHASLRHSNMGHGRGAVSVRGLFRRGMEVDGARGAA